MNFLEASRIKTPEGAPTLSFTLAMSGTSEPLGVFLAAHAGVKGLASVPQHIPFGTLSQHILTAGDGADPQVFVLMPWDLAAPTDWRIGTTETPESLPGCLEYAKATMTRISQFKNSKTFYLAAPIPHIFPRQHDNAMLEASLCEIAVHGGARPISARHFSMSNYLASGAPFEGSSLSEIAELIIEDLTALPSSQFKIVVTDADDTLWSGVIGEDGPEGVTADPSGVGFKHYVYQAFLKRLKTWGIVLAVASRNDEDMVLETLSRNEFILGEDDFVSIRARYGRKSDLIREISESINLSLDAFVFIDDNPLEIAEIQSTLPQVLSIPFPKDEAGLADLINRLGNIFDRGALTDEDKKRTEMYRRSAKLAETQDLESFLRQQEMTLKIFDKSAVQNERGFQLINKTNQFNMNGRRVSRNELDELLSSGGRLFTAELTDRHGSHGEIISCLLDRESQVISWVMSCRVLQRRVEEAFLVWLYDRVSSNGSELKLLYEVTERNKPFRNFFDCLRGKVDSEWSELEASEIDQLRARIGDTVCVEDKTHGGS